MVKPPALNQLHGIASDGAGSQLPEIPLFNAPSVGKGDRRGKRYVHTIFMRLQPARICVPEKHGTEMHAVTYDRKLL